MPSLINQAVEALTKQISEVQAVLLAGSRQDADTQADMWSDTDLLVVLNPRAAVKENELYAALHAVGTVVGLEPHPHHKETLLVRAAVEYEASLQMLDVQLLTNAEWERVGSQAFPFTVVYGKLPPVQPIRPALPDTSPFDAYDCNPTWFKYAIAIKKFARRDPLIGLHLLMELFQEYLVIEMMERDQRLGTPIHRVGTGERLPAALDLSSIDLTNREKLFTFIRTLACEYDSKLSQHLSGYQSRYPQIAAYIEKSQASLSD